MAALKKGASNSNAKPKRSSKRKGGKKGGGANRGPPVTYAKASKAKGVRTSGGKTSRCESGSDIINVVSIGGTAPTTATVLSSYLINPLTLLSGTRLRVLATLYQKYHFKKFKLVWEPELSTQFSGRVFAAVLANPELEFNYTGVNLLQKVTQLKDGNRLLNLLQPMWKSGSLDIPARTLINSPGQKMVIDPDNSDELMDCYGGKLIIGVDGPMTINTTYGTWRLDWELEFFDPVSEPALNAGVAQYLTTADPGQSKPWGSSIASTVFGDPNLAVLTANGTSNVLTFNDDGYYNIDVFYPTNTGGAAMTSSSTITGGNGATVTSTTIHVENGAAADQGKHWLIKATVLNGTTPGSNGYISISDSAGTHPPQQAMMTIIKYLPTVSLTRGERLRQQVADDKSSLEKRIAQLEALLLSGEKINTTGVTARPLAGIPVMEYSETMVTTNGGNSPPQVTTVTGETSQVFPIETEPVAPKMSKKALKKQRKSLRQQLETGVIQRINSDGTVSTPKQSKYTFIKIDAKEDPAYSPSSSDEDL